MDNEERKNDFKIISSVWENSSKKLKEQFPQLTDADLKFETGKENFLLDRIENKINKKRSEVIDIINKHQRKSGL